MKKILSVLLAVLMLVAALPMGAVVSAAETIHVIGTVDTGVVERGDTVTLTVAIQNNPGLVGWNVTVNFDTTAFELTEMTAGNVFPASGLSYGPLRSPASITFSDSIRPDVTGDGTMVYLTFRVKEDAAFGGYSFGVGTRNNDTDNFSNSAWDSFNVDFTSAMVEVINHVHTYDNDCDAVCNTCNDLRVAPHNYDNACDTTCNDCGTVRTVGDHVYTDGYDTTCNECGAVREIPTFYAVANGDAVRRETFTVSIYLKNNPGMVGWSLQIPFDTSVLELLSITGGTAFPASGMSYGPMRNPATATYADFVRPNVTNDGLLFTMEFKVLDNAPLGNYTLTPAARNNDMDNFVNEDDDTVCVLFDSLVIEILDHTHVYDHDCDATCNTCGAVRTVAPHPYVGTKTKEETCGANGEMVYVCSICGDTYTEVIPATGNHTYVSVVTKAATCVNTGVMTHTCSVCGDTYTTVIAIDPDNHTYQADYDPNCEDCNAWRTVENVPANAPALVVDSLSALYGKQFTVAVRVRNNPGMIGFQLSVEYDADLMTLISWKQGDYNSIACGPEANVPFRFSWADAVNPDNTTNGVLVYLTFEAKEGVDPTETAIAVRYLSEEIYNAAWENVCFAAIDGIIKLSNVTPGDVNEDGKVNIRDVGLMQQYMNGWEVTFNAAAADVNCDGKVNIRDVGLMQQYMNGWDVTLGQSGK